MTNFFWASLALVSVPPESEPASVSDTDSVESMEACAQQAAPTPLRESFDRLVDRIVSNSDGKGRAGSSAPGAVLAVISPDWSYCRAAGFTSAGGSTPLTFDAPFQIGSNTKMMTAAVLLQLHEEGRLSVDDQLSDHLPKIASRLPHGNEITLRQLANHTSGVYSYTDNAPDGTPGIMEGTLTDQAKMVLRFRPNELVDFAIKHGVPDFAPGENGRWNYSNTGYIILGLIIEKIAGQPLESVFEKRIFAPLGMTNSYLWSDVPRASFRVPDSYFIAPYEIEATDWNLSQGWAAGAVISTAYDMSIFVKALLNCELFDDNSTLALMQETVETGSPTIPRYGIGLAEKAPGIWGHGGQTMGFQSDVAYIPDLQVAITGWGNSANNLNSASAFLVASMLRSSVEDERE